MIERILVISCAIFLAGMSIHGATAQQPEFNMPDLNATSPSENIVSYLYFVFKESHVELMEDKKLLLQKLQATKKVSRELKEYLDELNAKLASHPPQIGVNYPGSDYHSFQLSVSDSRACQIACFADTRCRAWTYVHPNIQGASARCWLKTSVPKAQQDACCISGRGG